MTDNSTYLVLDAGRDLLLNLLREGRVGSVADALALFVLHVDGYLVVLVD